MTVNTFKVLYKVVDGGLEITLESVDYGEIRILTFTNKQVLNRMFRSQIKTWEKKYNEKTEAI